MRKIKKVIVTGATSMIGSALIEYLVDRNIKVLAVCRKETSKIENLILHPNVKVQFADLNELDQLESTEQYDACYHFAWQGTNAEYREDVYLQNSNIKYTLDAVKMAKRLGCKVFIGAGSQSEYGRVEGKLSPETKIAPENAYGISKYCAGKISAVYAKQLNIKHIWVRIVSVYGPRCGESSMIISTIQKLLKGEEPEFTKGEQVWDYLYCEDAARALYLLANKGKDQEVYCMGSGNPEPLITYLYKIRDAINPNISLRIGKKPYIDNQIMYLCADISKLTQDTGFIPKISFEEGIKKTINYCKK
ncbi:NAD-dependent epimerase/dehydratase family protein [Cellulosilyticum lentocellum]|uniref:NAD-dependent epimerase/dehydratase n=1 Tax=Cellulosilyticum lentocellum (strain ATCC 49066 / DSM 5427 / NCIMB 11756 / RHM5) TaxID=642492 RepID=F2JLP6_CELLD|nr:NAD(P)-dependent oxidoreductase [Cellulosilyticum lentocellum]ADZ83437.1 NAD-dependent epimerase/dehydratase [Cellulosilyticum lentocellum DSM 5427]